MFAVISDLDYTHARRPLGDGDMSRRVKRLLGQCPADTDGHPVQMRLDYHRARHIAQAPTHGRTTLERNLATLSRTRCVEQGYRTQRMGGSVGQ